jgi:hypothetical protein
LAWWQLPLAPDARFIQRIFAVTGGLVLGLLTWVFFGFVVGFVRAQEGASFGVSLHLRLTLGVIALVVLGAFLGIPAMYVSITGLLDEMGTVKPAAFASMHFRLLALKVGIGIVIGFPAGLIMRSAFGLRVGLASGISIGAISAALGVIMDAIQDTPHSSASAASPATVLRRNRFMALTVAFSAGLLAWLVAGLVLGLVLGLGRESAVALGLVAGLAIVLLAGFPFSAFFNPWPSYFLTHFWLALRRRLPWRLSGFLSDAHGRGVLRQNGAVYQFRHIELQRRLADRSLNPRYHSF